MPQLSIHRQRAVTRIGKIRMGERKQPNRPGFQRSTFRFTSPNKAMIDMLATAYGGKVSKYENEWELDSEASSISVIVDTELSVGEQFRQQDGKTTTHRCDGVDCEWIELRRDAAGKKITLCEERGIVACRCDPEGLGADLPDGERACDLITTLRVMIPATGDMMMWEFASKGTIFNREVFGAVDSFKSMGIHHGYCLLTIHLEEKHRGDKVSKFGVARLTLDPNPPNFVAALLANTPEAQARALLSGGGVIPMQPLPSTGAQPLPSPGAQALPQRHPAAPEDDRKRREIEEAANAFMKEKGWLDAAHKSNLTAFKNACAPAGLWWPEVFVMAMDNRCDDWKCFTEFAAARCEEVKAARPAPQDPERDPFKDDEKQESLL